MATDVDSHGYETWYGQDHSGGIHVNEWGPFDTTGGASQTRTIHHATMTAVVRGQGERIRLRRLEAEVENDRKLSINSNGFMSARASAYADMLPAGAGNQQTMDYPYQGTVQNLSSVTLPATLLTTERQVVRIGLPAATGRSVVFSMKFTGRLGALRGWLTGVKQNA